MTKSEAHFGFKSSKDQYISEEMLAQINRNLLLKKWLYLLHYHTFDCDLFMISLFGSNVISSFWLVLTYISFEREACQNFYQPSLKNSCFYKAILSRRLIFKTSAVNTFWTKFSKTLFHNCINHYVWEIMIMHCQFIHNFENT